MKDNKYWGNVLQNLKYKEAQQEKEKGIGLAGMATGATESAAHNDRLNRFHARQGQGYAAEQTNDLIDTIHGKDAQILGDDNAKNGADRMVDGQLIQSKYCQTAKATINATFGDNGHGTYRYLDGNGKAMQVEVPSDQYDEAIKLMEEKIRQGKVPGVTNPKDAKKLVRKGNIDYQTACNIAKAGNIDSLLFDAAHGTVIAVSALGISGVITLARSLWSGDDMVTAVDKALCVGIHAGGTAFVTSVVTAQLTRTSVNNALMPVTNAMVKVLPSNIRNILVNTLRNGAPIYGAAATRNLSKLMRSNLIAQGVLLAVMSASDIRHFFSGKISGKQLFKNVTTAVGGIGGGTVGAAIGGAVGSVVPVAGTEAGAFIGGMVGGAVSASKTRKLLDNFIEDDAIAMARILEDRFVPMAQDYLLTKEEMTVITEDLQFALGQKGLLLDMYAARDRNAFADDLLRQTVEKTTAFRTRIILPPTEFCMKRLNEVLADGYILSAQALPENKSMGQIMAKKLLDRDVSKRAADKAWYVTKQWNLMGVQEEILMEKMHADEIPFSLQQQQMLAQSAELSKETEDLHNELEQYIVEIKNKYQK